MTVLLIGLLLFLGVHSVRIVANDWRSATLARVGEMRWKGVFSLLSALGLALLVWGYGLARQQPLVLWQPPLWTRHLASLLTLAAFVLVAAAYVPRNAFKARLHHPMVLGVKSWALAHLLANGNAADVLLFGAFLLWAAASFRAARRRDRASHAARAPGSLMGTLFALMLGVTAWAGFALWAHAAWIGVRPFG